MPDYRRNRVPGGTFFFTANLLDRLSDLLVAQIDALRDVVRQVRARAPFHIDAWVVLPDHMHCLWTLPEGDADFPGRWRAIKKGFSKSVRIGESRSPVMTRRGERGIWQRRYWEHTIRDDRDFAAHMDYIHFNPVKHVLVAHPAEWPHSSFRRCVAGGLSQRGGWAAAASRQRRVSGNEIETAKAQAKRISQRRKALRFSALRLLVKHGYAPRVQDWPYSSFRRWVRLGSYPEDWAGPAGDEAHSFGER